MKRSTGLSLRKFAEAHIFAPLEMHASFYCDDTTEIVRKRAEGYVPISSDQGSGYTIGRTGLNLVGDGAVFSTVLDLAKWDANFYHHKVGGEALHKVQHSEGALNNGTGTGYAAGLFVGTYRGLRQVSHSGAFTGFRTEIMRFPDQHFSVICLANDDSAMPTKWCMQVASLFLEDAFTEEAPTPRERGERRERKQAPVPTPASLSGIEGTYFSIDLDTNVRLEFEADGLHYRVRHLDAGPIGLSKDGTHTTSVMDMRFTRDDTGKVTSFTLGGGRASGMSFTRVSQ